MRGIESRRFDRLLYGLALLIMAAALAVEPHGLPDKIDRAGFAVCHQIVSRTYSFAGRTLPLCARCSGTFLGAVGGLFALILRHRGRRVTGFPARRFLFVFAIFMLLWLADGLNSFLTLFAGMPHLYEPHNLLRLITGTMQGLTLASFLMPILNSALWADTSSEPSVGSMRDLAWMIFSGVAVIALVSSGWPILYYPLTIASGCAIVCLIGSLNTTVLLLLLRREGCGRSWRDVIAPGLAGVGLGIAEIAVIGALRDAVTAWAGLSL